MSDPVTKYRSDPRRPAIERAIRTATLALLARDQTVAEVVAALTDAVADEVPPDITPPEG